MSTAFVIGNGLSRVDINLNLIQKYGMTYGCNALYRDFSPDVLVSTDDGISIEIQQSKYPITNTHYTRTPIAKSGSLKLPMESSGMSSGPNALYLAITKRHDTIYMLGLDFGSIAEKFNNVYAGTNHYKHELEQPTYSGNWVYNISRMIELNKNTKFIRVVDRHSKKDLFSFNNYREITVNEFAKKHK